jgi:hypothetical protein
VVSHVMLEESCYCITAGYARPVTVAHDGSPCLENSSFLPPSVIVSHAGFWWHRHPVDTGTPKYRHLRRAALALAVFLAGCAAPGDSIRNGSRSGTVPPSLLYGPLTISPYALSDPALTYQAEQQVQRNLARRCTASRAYFLTQPTRTEVPQ